MLAALCALPAATLAGERLVLYLNEDNERVRIAVGKLREALDAQGVSARHRIRIEHVVCDPGHYENTRRVLVLAMGKHPDAIVASNGLTTQVAREVAGRTPVIFGMHQDPVVLGVAESYRAPGGNATGLTLYRNDEEKRLELLREIAPSSRRLGVIVDEWWDRGATYRHPSAGRLERIAREQFGFEVRFFQVDELKDLEALSSAPKAREIDVWYVPVVKAGFDHPEEFTKRMAGFRRPVIYSLPLFAQSGGLISYQQNFDSPFATWATMIGLVLDGFPPGEIPVERPKVFELAVNLEAARSQGIAIPKSILRRATHFYPGP